jgi:hypothetical protein
VWVTLIKPYWVTLAKHRSIGVAELAGAIGVVLLMAANVTPLLTALAEEKSAPAAFQGKASLTAKMNGMTQQLSLDPRR